MRKWLANALARLARRIYPESEEVMSFYTDRLMEMALTGNSFIKIESIDLKDVCWSDGDAPEQYTTKKSMEER